MEKRIVKTLIKKDHKLGNNEYVKGRISGIQSIMCPRDFEFGTGRNEDGFILVAECDVNQYDRFINVIEEMYPGLCIFDYRESK